MTPSSTSGRLGLGGGILALAHLDCGLYSLKGLQMKTAGRAAARVRGEGGYPGNCRLRHPQTVTSSKAASDSKS